MRVPVKSIGIEDNIILKTSIISLSLPIPLCDDIQRRHATPPSTFSELGIGYLTPNLLRGNNLSCSVGYITLSMIRGLTGDL
jgi:hypothetical protein